MDVAPREHLGYKLLGMDARARGDVLSELRAVLTRYNLTDQHALDLLEAFRRAAPALHPDAA